MSAHVDSKCLFYGKIGGPWGSIGLLILILSVATNLVAKTPPLQDLNEWAYQGYLIQHLAFGHAIPAALKFWPVPNAFSQLALALLATCLYPITAVRSFSCLYLLISGGMMWRISRGPHSTVDGLRFLLLISLAVIHAPYWSGELNYQVGLVALTYYFARYGQRNTPGPLVDVPYSILLFACHALCLGMFLIYVGWRSLLQRKIVQGAISAVPAAVLLAWYTFFDPRTDYDPNDPLSVGPRLSGAIEHVAYQFYVLAKVGPYQNMVLGNQGDYQRCAPFYWLGHSRKCRIFRCDGPVFRDVDFPVSKTIEDHAGGINSADLRCFGHRKSSPDAWYRQCR